MNLGTQQPEYGYTDVDSLGLGIGSYAGEIRQGADGQLYQWVEGVDGLGNPIGFWKAIKTAAKTVGRAARTVGKAVSTAAGKVTGLLDPVKHLFALAVKTNVASAKRMKVPADFIAKVRGYAAANNSDGRILMGALSRKPRFYRGGWILKLQPKAAAVSCCC